AASSQVPQFPSGVQVCLPHRQPIGASHHRCDPGTHQQACCGGASGAASGGASAAWSGPASGSGSTTGASTGGGPGGESARGGVAWTAASGGGTPVSGGGQGTAPSQAAHFPSLPQVCVPFLPPAQSGPEGHARGS